MDVRVMPSPDGDGEVSVYRTDRLLLLMIPTGMPVTEAQRQTIELLTSEERDHLRMAFGMAPVVMDPAGAGWGPLDDKVWCPDRIPPWLRVVEVACCHATPMVGLPVSPV